MKRLSIIASVLALAVVCYACSTVEPLTDHHLSNARAHFPDATLEQLTSGRGIYTRKCGSCHYLYPPSKLTLDEWRDELAIMKGKAKISDSEAMLIEKFLSTAAKE